MAEENQKIILANILVISKIIITFNYQLSKCRKAFLVITGYFFIKDFSFREALLRFKPLYNLYKGKYLIEVVIQVLIKYGFLY